MQERVFGLLALVTALAFSPQAWAADVLAYPQWNSIQVRAARSLAPEDALVFELRSEETGGGASARVTLSTVTLTASYTHIVTGAAHVLDDHALCRTLSWSDDKAAMDSESCYAMPAFRISELANRRLLGGILGAVAKDKSLPAAPYWAEAELAVQDQETDPLVRRAIPNGIDYLLGDEAVVRLSDAPVKLTDSEAKWVARYFANHQPLHPQVRHNLRSDDNLPARIEIETRAGGDTRRLVLTISKVRRAKLDYPLPTGLESALRLLVGQGDAADSKGMQQALLAIDGTSEIEKPTSEALLSAMQAASDRHHPVEVTLLFLQFAQQYESLFKGPDAPALLNRLRQFLLAAKNDAAAGRLLDANGLAGDSAAPGDREAAAHYLAFAHELDRLPFGTFRYVTFANLVRSSKDTSRWDPSILKAMPSPLVQNYWLHIAAYPWASNAYKDSGDTDLSDYDMRGAWLAYDLGRAIDKDWRSGVMSVLGAFEDRLRSNQPDFF